METELLTGAFVIIIQKKNGGFKILTQTRNCREKPEDAIYNNTQECIGERSAILPGKTFPRLECVLKTAERGIWEEISANPDGFIILGAGGKIAVPLITTTSGHDRMMVVDPYTFYQTLEGSRPRFAPVFIAVAPTLFVPKLNTRKEVKGFSWWSPERLLEALQNKPWCFSYTHPILLKLCLDFIKNSLQIDI